MKTDELIQALVDDFRPVRRLRSVELRTICWLGFTFLFVILGTLVCGLRPDIFEKSHDPFFLFEGMSLLILFFLAARSAFQLSIPGSERAVSTIFLPLLVFFVWLLLVLTQYLAEVGAGKLAMEMEPRFLCIYRILGLGVLPVAVCVVLLRRAAPQKKRWAGFFTALAGFSVAALGSQALCTIDRPLHTIIWHVLPVFLIGLLGAGLGKLVFHKTWRPEG